MTAPKKGGPKETTVIFETVTAPADVLPHTQTPKSGSGLRQSKANVPPGDTLHAGASVAPSVLEDIVERQHVAGHLQQLADKAKRQSQMIEPLPIKPEVEQTPKVKRPIDNIKKQHFKGPPAYDGTLGCVVKEEDDGDKVKEEPQQEVIDAARDELNETSPVMVDGKQPEVLY